MIRFLSITVALVLFASLTAHGQVEWPNAQRNMTIATAEEAAAKADFDKASAALLERMHEAYDKARAENPLAVDDVKKQGLADLGKLQQQLQERLTRGITRSCG